MNNQARFCKLKCKYNVQGICHAYGECIAKDLFIAELEKIKTRIDEEVVYVNKWQVKNDSIKIIDERISELKGE